MVKKLVPMLERTRRGCFIVRGKILPADYFLPNHDNFPRRLHEGIENVTDIIVGYYRTGLKSRMTYGRNGDLYVGMCLYRVNDKRYRRRELTLAKDFLRTHERLFDEGILGWHWRWPALMEKSLWLSWLHHALDWRFARPSSKGPKPKKKTLSNNITKLKPLIGVNTTAEAVQAFFWRPISSKGATRPLQPRK